jgi:hypothetical protein
MGIGLQNVGRDREAKKAYLEYLKLQPKGAHASEVRLALQSIP